MNTTLWQMAQVAGRLGLTAASFRARRRRLEQDHAFPAPVPGVGLRWDGAAVEAWLARQRDGGGGQQDGADVLVARARAMVSAVQAAEGALRHSK